MNAKKELYFNDKLIKKSLTKEKLQQLKDSRDVRTVAENTTDQNFSNNLDPFIYKSNKEEDLTEIIKLNKPFMKNDISLTTRYKISNQNLKNSIENLKYISKKKIDNMIDPFKFKHGRTLSHQIDHNNRSVNPALINTPDKAIPYMSKLQTSTKKDIYTIKKKFSKKLRFSEIKIENNPTMNININLNMNMNLNNKDNTNVLPNLNHRQFSKEKENFKTNDIFNLLNSINHIKQKSNPQVALDKNRFFYGTNSNYHVTGNPHGNNFSKEKETNFVPNSTQTISMSKEKYVLPATFKIKKFSPIKFASNLNEEQNVFNEKNIKNKFENVDELVKRPSLSLIKNVCVKSRAGVNYEGIVKTNQDSFLVKEKIFNLDNYSIFGVFDGHGLHGHLVSNKIKIFFTDFFSNPETFGFKDKNKKASNNYFNSKITNSNWKNLEKITEEIIYEKLKEKNYELIRNSFYLAESSLLHTNCEVNFSGTTTVLVIIIGDKIICANAGDSRAILISEKENSRESSVIPLSRDHKPDLSDESKRIIKSGGRVDRYSEDGVRSGPFRVWLRNETYPGLAMSRSIGDLVASSVGVICEPEIIEHIILKNNFKYIVIASDGVWEFLSNERVKEIVDHHYKIDNFNAAASKLVEESVRFWRKEDEVIDDITAVVIFFDRKPEV